MRGFEQGEPGESGNSGVRARERCRPLGPKAAVLVGAVAVVIFLALHLVQLDWFDRRCGVGASFPWRPASCEAYAVRVWFLPGGVGLGLSLVVGLRMAAGSWRRARAILLRLAHRLLSWSPSGMRKNSGAVGHPRWVTLACCAFGALLVALVFFARNGTSVLDSRNTGWLSSGDPAQAYLGSVLYRTEPWGFPLGRLDAVMAPVGTNVGFTDPVLLLAVLAKVARGVFPPEGQYFGAWMLFCYLAFGAGCGLVAARLALPLASRLAATGLLALFPPLFFREGHFTLNAMFLIPLATHALQREARSSGGAWPFATQGLLLIATAWLHPYLTILVGVFFVAHAWNVARERKVAPSVLAALCAGSSMVVVLSWWIIGYVGSGIPPGEPERPDFWTANLNGFFNSMDKSAFLRGLPLATGGQYEGFGYLGLGVLLGHLALFARSGGALFVRTWSGHKALCLALLLGLILSQGCLLSFGTIKVELPLWGYGEALSPFRSVGRFIWIPAFLVSVLALAFVSAREGERRPSRVSLLLMGLLGIQWVDLAPFRVARTWDSPHFRPAGVSPGAEGDAQLRAWGHALVGKRAIVAFPPFATGVAKEGDFALFWFLSLRNGVRTNVGYVSRFDQGASEPEGRRIRALVSGAPLPASILFVTSAATAPSLGVHPANVCEAIGGHLVCSDRE